MSGSTTIRYYRQEQVDRVKWDACIQKADNGLVYGYSFYLHFLSDHWDALVMGDYEAVMPLPWRKKMGIYYLYQPFLTAQLGVFGNRIGKELLEEFLNAVPRKFRWWDFPLNHKNVFPVPGYAIFERSNYVLDLSPSYEVLSRNYRENIRRNIKKSIQYGCTTQKDFDIQEIFHLALRSHAAPSLEDLNRFLPLYRHLHAADAATCYGIYSAQGQLLASAVFLFSHNRAYYILVGNHPNGRTLGASHALIDAFIRDHSGKDILLDFEGSDLRNLAFFYSSFGAREEKYASIRVNRLPWYMRWVK